MPIRIVFECCTNQHYHSADCLIWRLQKSEAEVERLKEQLALKLEPLCKHEIGEVLHDSGLYKELQKEKDRLQAVLTELVELKLYKEKMTDYIHRKNAAWKEAKNLVGRK